MFGDRGSQETTLIISIFIECFHEGPLGRGQALGDQKYSKNCPRVAVVYEWALT